MRQRIQPKVGGGTPIRGALERNASIGSGRHSAKAWEITSDDGGETSTAAAQPVPMYNPLHYSSNSSVSHHVPTPPGSFPVYDPKMKKHDDPLHYNLYHNAMHTSPSSQSLSQMPSLAPSIIPDKHYKAYLHGRPTNHNPTAAWWTDTRFLAQLLAQFSMVAVGFLLFVGFLLDRQPLYIPGTLTKHVQFTTGDRKPQVFYALNGGERLDTAHHAYQAALAYGLTALICWAYVYNWKWYLLLFRKNYYQNIPDHASDVDSTVTSFHHGGGDTLPTSTYQRHHGQLGRIRETAGVTFNRVVIYLATIWPRYQESRRARRRQAGPKEV